MAKTKLSILTLYAIRHILYLIPDVRQIFGGWSAVESNLFFLPSDFFALLVIYAWANRVPDARSFIRAVWKCGREFLIFSYFLAAVCLVWLNKAILFNTDHRLFNFVVVLLFLDLLAIAYLHRSPQLKIIFETFPPPDLADQMKAALSENAKAKRDMMLEAKLAVPIAREETTEAQLETRLRALLVSDPTNAMGWFGLGVMAFQYNKCDQSRAFMNKALACDAQNPIILRSLCELSRQMGRVKEAVRYGREAVALAPKDEIAQLNLALALTDANEFDSAITHYHRVLDLNPHHLQAWLNLSALLAQRNRKEDALAALDAVLLIDPNEVNALSLKQQLIKS